MSSIGGDDVPANAAAFHHGASGRIPDFQGAAGHRGADHGEDSSRAKVQQSMHNRKAVLDGYSHFLEFDFGAGLEADGGSGAPEKEICPRIFAGADDGALLKNMAFSQIGERDAIFRVFAFPTTEMVMAWVEQGCPGWFRPPEQ